LIFVYIILCSEGSEEKDAFKYLLQQEQKGGGKIQCEGVLYNLQIKTNYF